MIVKEDFEDVEHPVYLHLLGLCWLQAVLLFLAFNTHLDYIELRRAFLKDSALSKVRRSCDYL